MLSAGQAAALELGVGYGFVEQGDDRTQPVAAVHGEYRDYIANLYYYGREFGPIRQDTVIISGARRWWLFGGEDLSVNLGVTLLDERITVEYRQTQYAGRNATEDNFNVGANFGVAWSILPKLIRPFWAQVGWDSHIYAAGLEGGILLSTGRKQVVALSVGVDLK